MSHDLVDHFVTENVHLLTQAAARLHHCVRQLDHKQLWWVPGPGQNSVGVLLRHLAGNLQQWAVVGVKETEDHRDRLSEFESATHEPAEQLLRQIDKVVAEAIGVIERLTAEELTEKRVVQGFTVTVMGALMHTVPHFVGHTHQVVALTRMQLAEDYQYHWDPNAPRNEVPL